MRLTVLLVLTVFALPASAEFAVVEETEAMTVYRDGNQVIVLAEGKSKGDMRDAAKARGPERAVSSSFRSQLSGKDRYYFYLVRTRFLDGEAVCEKFYVRPADEAERNVVLQIMALAPCGQNF